LALESIAAQTKIEIMNLRRKSGGKTAEELKAKGK
jgi:hypothetical protein